MTRFAAKIDKNQPEIVAALRSAGISVQSTAGMGKGFPDLVAANSDGKVWLIEVKGPKGKLTDDQILWIESWRGVVHIVRSADEALKLVGVIE